MGCPHNLISIVCSKTFAFVSSLELNQAMGQFAHQEPVVCNMSFSADGQRLAVGLQSPLAVLVICSRTTPMDSFRPLCTQAVDIVSHTHAPSFASSGHELLCWIGVRSITMCKSELLPYAAAIVSHMSVPSQMRAQSTS